MGTFFVRGPDGRHLRPLHVRVGPERLGECVLRSRGGGRRDQLESDLLRLARRVELHHRRQVARVSLGHGDLSAPVRVQRVERAGAAGTRGRRDRRPRVRRRAAVVRLRGGLDRRGCGSPDPCRRADVSLQQPRRAARAPADRRRVRDFARGGKRFDQVARSGRGSDRHRFSGQDAAGIRRGAGGRPHLPRPGTPAIAAPNQAARDRGLRPGARLRLVGRRGRAVAERGPPLHRRIPEQQPLEPDLRLQRRRPHHRQ